METSKTSLKGWKLLFERQSDILCARLKNFLKGMETYTNAIINLNTTILKNFLKGMETHPEHIIFPMVTPSKTSLKGWKLGFPTKNLDSPKSLKNFLKGMETLFCRQVHLADVFPQKLP